LLIFFEIFARWMRILDVQKLITRESTELTELVKPAEFCSYGR
jgi:hypothetical protein